MKAIIFDMDGLMIDTERLYIEVERELANSFGEDLKEETIWKMMGRKPLEAMSVFAEDLDLKVPAQELLAMRDNVFQERLIKEVAPMPGLFEILDQFKGSFLLAIATGSPIKFVDIVMEKLKLGTYFDIIQTADEIINGKPDPEIYLKTIDKLKVQPKDCIVLEDSGNGAFAGKRAGCYVIAVPSEYTNRQDFSFVDFKVKDLNEARVHIKGRGTLLNF